MHCRYCVTMVFYIRYSVVVCDLEIYENQCRNEFQEMVKVGLNFDVGLLVLHLLRKYILIYCDGLNLN